MESNQKNLIETAPADPVQPDPPQSTISDLTDSFSLLLIIFGLLTGIKKLWISIDKLRKKRKCSPKLLLSIISALLAIWKAIEQMNDGE